jgi:(1->4)-alpha-D-glucan 1-alpha-D-glucosylmutase
MIATYRLQLTPDFTFHDVQQLLPYLSRLGISHLYLSPVMQARPESSHGYDVIDHNELRDAFGGREAFGELLAAARDREMAIILDFVPNHAYVGPHNQYWQDVLAYGPHSPYASYFDIDWHPLKRELQNKILLPFLGEQYGTVLENDEIHITYEDGRFYAEYYDNRFALSPASYDLLLASTLEQYEQTDPYWEIKKLTEAYDSLAPGEREKAETLRSRLTSLSEQVAFDEAVSAMDQETLHGLLERQFWRLSFWKTAGYEINYRRFFDINGLAALRMEDEEVFWDTHRLLGDLLTEDGVTGVRIDHIDGLFEPHEYLDRLTELNPEYIWVEKILAPGETLPDDWPVDGTTGYEFLNDAMGVLLQPEGEIPMTKLYNRFVEPSPSFDESVYNGKMLVMHTSLSSERFRLSYELDRIAEADYHTRDFTLVALRESLSEILASFDRYRTYLPHNPDEAHEAIREVIYRARQRNPATEPTVYDFIADVLRGDISSELEERRRAWIGRFQQYTAPVAAKGVEDTAFYRYHRLAALNEVGGDPGQFGQSLHAFHARAKFRAHRYPDNLLTTATHDHKRGEDTRMRLIALAEIPEQWEETVQTLTGIAEEYRGVYGPSSADQYLFYQILAAQWHDTDRDTLPDRLCRYMEKATRESKRRSSWINPSPDYEEDLESFIRGMIDDPRTSEAIEPIAHQLGTYGFFNSLSQLILKCTTPGVPDFYQGCELQDLSLVDPDNRRPVDYNYRRQLLEDLEDAVHQPSVENLRNMLDNRLRDKTKLYVTTRLLELRRSYPDLFDGDYYALTTDDTSRTFPWIAFGRTHDETALIGLVPRYPDRHSTDETCPIELPHPLQNRTWQELLTGQTVEAKSKIDPSVLPLPWNVLVSA